MSLLYAKIYVTPYTNSTHRIEQMSRFLDSHKIGSFTEEELMKLQNSSVDEFGVEHLNILYNYEANVVYCLLEAPSREAVEKNHAKLGYKCDWITEVKTTA
jgi:hypothetical protein